VRKEEGGERRAVGEWREVERRKEEGSCADGGGRREEGGGKEVEVGGRRNEGGGRREEGGGKRTRSMKILTKTRATRSLNLTLSLTYILKYVGRRKVERRTEEGGVRMEVGRGRREEAKR